MKSYLTKSNRFYIIQILSIGFALLLLLFRIKLTHSYFYLFLVWNLFLAGIPYAITQVFKMNSKLRSSKIMSFLGFGFWLLFLPNSPYIITDLVHLQPDYSNLMWLDIFLIFVFAFNGLLLGLLSIMDMYSLISERYGERIAKYTIFQTCLLSGYGIYLGRFLRFNSWDITTKPKTLLLEIVHSAYDPMAWLMTFAFGGFLWILFLLMQSVFEIQLQPKRP